MRIKDKKISILESTIVEDDLGNQIEEWRPIFGGENIWAYYRQVSGKEYFAAAVVNVKVEAVFEINWRDDIGTDMIIEYRDNRYNIARIDDFEGYKDSIKIYAYAKSRPEQ